MQRVAHRLAMPTEKWARARQMRRIRRPNVMAGFIVDFVALGGRLVIEIDGRIHDETVLYDAERDRVIGRPPAIASCVC